MLPNADMSWYGERLRLRARCQVRSSEVQRYGEALRRLAAGEFAQHASWLNMLVAVLCVRTTAKLGSLLTGAAGTRCDGARPSQDLLLLTRGCNSMDHDGCITHEHAACSPHLEGEGRLQAPANLRL